MTGWGAGVSGPSFTLAHMDPFEEVAIDAMEERLNRGWQGWHLDKDQLALRHETLAVTHGYEIDLLTCTTSAAVLGWIMEISPGLGAPVMGLVRAFDDILQPRINLCLDGETRSRRLTQRQIRRLVAEAEEPGPDGPR
jgi:hypothetical protein